MNQTMAARTITVDGKKYSVTLLPGTVHKTKKGGRYSSQKRYDCGAYKAFGGNNCLCNCFQAAKGCRQFRVKEVDSDNEAIDVFLCPNDELHLGLMTVEEDELESVLVPETQICHLPRPGGGTFQVCLLKGSCRAFAAELSSNDHLFVHRRQPPPGEEFLKHAEALFGVRHEGGRRGSEFFGTPNMGDCMHALRSIDECNEVLDDIEKADKCQIALILSVFYGMGNTANKKVNFILHADKPYYNKPPQRSNWTAYSNRDDEDEGDKMLRHLRNNSVMANGDGDDEEKASEEEDNKWDVQAIGKVMRFQCRETGWWFDIHCTNGTIVQQSQFASGIGSHIEHAIFNASKTVTITWDHGPRYDKNGNRVETISQKDLDAADEVQYKDNEEEEVEEDVT